MTLRNTAYNQEP